MAGLKLRVIPRLPASFHATGGLSVEKANGVWTLSPDWTDLDEVTVLPDPGSKDLWILDPVTGVYSRLSVQALIDNLPVGPAGADGSLIFVQNSAPATNKPANSLWIDADSTDLDLFQLVSSAWTDTGVNLKGATGPAAWSAPTAWLTATAYVVGPPASVVTQGGETYVCLISHTSGTFATDLAASKWIKVAAKGADGTGTGDFSSNTSSSVDGEMLLFSGTAGKTGKRSTLTGGMLKSTSGIPAIATADTDYTAPATFNAQRSRDSYTASFFAG